MLEGSTIPGLSPLTGPVYALPTAHRWHATTLLGRVDLDIIRTIR
jgi:hypothetical protein